MAPRRSVLSRVRWVNLAMLAALLVAAALIALGPSHRADLPAPEPQSPPVPRLEPPKPVAPKRAKPKRKGPKRGALADVDPPRAKRRARAPARPPVPLPPPPPAPPRTGEFTPDPGP